VTTTSRLRLPGRATWRKLCACRECSNGGKARIRKRQIKRAENREARREIETDRYEEP
jgi:hypothetical protein